LLGEPAGSWTPPLLEAGDVVGGLDVAGGLVATGVDAVPIGVPVPVGVPVGVLVPVVAGAVVVGADAVLLGVIAAAEVGLGRLGLVAEPVVPGAGAMAIAPTFEPPVAARSLARATEPLCDVAVRKPVTEGAEIDPTARLVLLAALRKPTAVGGGMIMPIWAAIDSMRWSSPSVATLARSCWFSVDRVDACWTERPIPAPSLSTSTCMKTIPASITPRTGIQA
jgi:hypothetical protein